MGSVGSNANVCMPSSICITLNQRHSSWGNIPFSSFVCVGKYKQESVNKPAVSVSINAFAIEGNFWRTLLTKSFDISELVEYCQNCGFIPI